MYTYTHLRMKQLSKKEIIVQVIKMAEACGKTCREQTLNKYDKDQLYNKYLKYRNEYVLFHKK